jgi:hypothetical protein
MHQLLSFFLVDSRKLSKLLNFKGKMTLFTFQATDRTRIYIDLQSKFSVILLRLLDLVPEKVQFILGLVRSQFHVSHLTALNLHLSIERPYRLSVL